MISEREENEMDKRKVEEWLDNLVEAVKLYEDSRIFNQDISRIQLDFMAFAFVI